MKRIAVIGATGSIGTSALEVVRTHPDDFRVVAVAARTPSGRLAALGREFGAAVFTGADAAVRAAESCEADLVLVATVGLSGLRPVLTAIDRGIDVALATKEVLVAAGELVMARAREKGVHLLPVDSEHSAIFQCLQTRGRQTVERLSLTASGGPFLSAAVDLSAVTPDMALNHPRWNMGPKVTVDSSTLMNKGFEIAEARWLFDIPLERIEVVIHPESVVHSFVTFADGSTLAQLAPPDMGLPIQFAFSWPDRLPSRRERLDLPALGCLHFQAPDETRFPCLRLVKAAMAAGGTRPAVLSAADEIAVRRFLAGDIRYPDIPVLVERTLAGVPERGAADLAGVEAADAAAREFAAAARF
ncbi:MAG: 1-deoxy-D-xylulose-5-phosphate reductoisomerase [Kiritimatiellia bacterium]